MLNFRLITSKVFSHLNSTDSTNICPSSIPSRKIPLNFSKLSIVVIVDKDNQLAVLK